MRIGYFGPEGTYTHEAMLASARTLGVEVEEVPLPTIYDTVMAVHDGSVERALVPIENSLEGSVNATLDALAHETERVEIVGEVVMPIRHCLIVRAGLPLALGEIETVVSHPQANAQCARFIRTSLPQARVIAGSSTAEAVQTVAHHDGPWAALGNRTAAERYGCVVLAAGVEDVPGNETRFVWLARADPDRDAGWSDDAHSARGAGWIGGAAPERDARPDRREDADVAYKTAIVFWGAGTERPGWLVACLSAFAERGVNLTRIESRPRRRGLGSYMFFVDLEGRARDPHVMAGLAAVREHAEVVRVIGSFPAARG